MSGGGAGLGLGAGGGAGPGVGAGGGARLDAGAGPAVVSGVDAGVGVGVGLGASSGGDGAGSAADGVDAGLTAGVAGDDGDPVAEPSPAVDTEPEGIRAEWVDGAVVVHGGPDFESLAVVPVSALDLGADLIATAGSWTRAGGGVARFVPRFAPVPGLAYAVVGRADACDSWHELARVGAPAGLAVPAPSTVIVAIDPGGAQVPANLLRFAVSFSAPMDEGSAAGRIRLRDADGVEIPGALLVMPPELWDRDRRRLTVLLEPGRIKRGLQPNVQAGPPLVEGELVTLEVDATIRDAAGAELVEGAARRFRVGPAVRSRVDPSRWTIGWPGARAGAGAGAGAGGDVGVGADADADADVGAGAGAEVGAEADAGGGAGAGAYAGSEVGAGAGGAARAGVGAGQTSAALVVRFDRPLDRALVRRCLGVIDESGQPVAGSAALNEDATVWCFVPAGDDVPIADWALRVDPALEDLAGNSVRRVFDHDLRDPAIPATAAAHLLRPRPR